jgi:hypothetical protein
MPAAFIQVFISDLTLCYRSYSSIKAKSSFRSSAKLYLIFVFKFGWMDVYENEPKTISTSDNFDSIWTYK